MSLLPLTGLADPQFVERDPQKIVEEMIAQYETVTGRTLYPAQVERLVIDLVAYRESMTREAIQDAGKQNLVSFARAPFLDYLGELLGIRRLPGSSARTLLRFTFAAPLATSLVIPAGTRAQDSGGAFVFVVSADGKSAEKRPVRLGRRNPDFVEVIGGLQPGDRIITSSYSGFTDKDRLTLSGD